MQTTNSTLIRTSRKLKFPLKKNTFEYAAWQQGSVICGLDEVGRGCLAGPVVAGAVILPCNSRYRLLKDSKLLDEPDRILAHKWIIKNCWFGLGIINPRLIDKHNIWQANILAMKRALIQLLTVYPATPQAIITDAVPLELADTNFNDIPLHYFAQAERKSISVAAASILAKVTRDNLMRRMNPIFPGYFLNEHKGYSTQKHKESLREKSRTIIHRNSFLTWMEAIADEQQSLFSLNPPK